MVQEIHEKALAAARRFKAAEVELIEVLQLVGEHRVFYHYKFNSLFQYAVQALSLSEEVAYIYINVSRKAAQVPRLKEEIAAGRITVSKAKTISSVLTPENQEHWLEIARTKSKRQVEREVALASPRHAVREKAVYRSGGYVELKLGVPEGLMLKFRHVQDLVSQSKQSHASLVETLEAMTELYLAKKDPLEKAKRQYMRGKLDADVKTPVPGPVPASTRNRIYLRYQGQCAHIDEHGLRCPQRRLLEIHHIQPVSEGGTNDIANLILLCQGHHRAQHVS